MWTAWSICSMKSQLNPFRISTRSQLNCIHQHFYFYNLTYLEVKQDMQWEKMKRILCIRTDRLLRPWICIEEVNHYFILVTNTNPWSKYALFVSAGYSKNMQYLFQDLIKRKFKITAFIRNRNIYIYLFQLCHFNATLPIKSIILFQRKKWN